MSSLTAVTPVAARASRVVAATRFRLLLGDRLSEMTDLQQVLGRHLRQAAHTWPGISLDRHTFLRYLAERLPRDTNPLQALRRLHATDLYLCCGCVQRNQAAVAAFYERYTPVIDQMLRELRLPTAMVEDLRQALVERLLLGLGDKAPLISRYSGSGRLTSWLRVVTLRTARKATSKQRRFVASGDERLLSQLAGPSRNSSSMPRTEQAYRKKFQAALRRSLSELSPRDRALLRFRFADDQPLHQIAAVYRVHHTTVWRWLQNVQKRLMQDTCTHMAVELGISETDCVGIILSIQSSFDQTLSLFYSRSPSEVETR